MPQSARHSLRSFHRSSSPPLTPGRAQVRIDRIGAEADGLARLPDGIRLFVPGTLPGESVLATPLAPRGGGWHAEAATIIAPSPARVAPPCPHFGACGGCALQHWREADYRAWKADLLRHALASAGIPPPEPTAFVPGLPGERRRLDFAVRRSGERAVLGLHAPRSQEVIDLAGCLVLHPALMALIAPLRRLLPGLRCIRREASVIANLLGSGPDLLLRVDAEPSAQDRAALVGFARAHDLPRLSVAAGQAPAEAVCLLRPPSTSLSGVPVVPPAGAFLQATVAGEAAIVAAVLAGLPQKRTARFRVAELYAGCGTLTFALAPHVRVAAFEGDAHALAALRHAANHATLAGRVEPVRRDLARQPLAARELAGFGAVVLDPPHAGAAAQVAQIAAARVPTVIYVSCNPATLSRDARMLTDAGYGLQAATAIDQFLYSPRLESVCVFRAG